MTKKSKLSKKDKRLLDKVESLFLSLRWITSPWRSADVQPEHDSLIVAAIFMFDKERKTIIISGCYDKVENIFIGDNDVVYKWEDVEAWCENEDVYEEIDDAINVGVCDDDYDYDNDND